MTLYTNNSSISISSVLCEAQLLTVAINLMLCHFLEHMQEICTCFLKHSLIHVFQYNTMHVLVVHYHIEMFLVDMEALQYIRFDYCESNY